MTKLIKAILIMLAVISMAVTMPIDYKNLYDQNDNIDQPNLTDKQILQQGLNGLFEQNKLPDPTTIMPCIDDATAHKIVVFIGQVLDKAAKGSISDIIGLIDLVKKFGDQIPQSVKDCLDGNAEFKALGLKYGIDDSTTSDQIQKKIIAYVTLHYIEVHKELGTLDSSWKSGKYYDTAFQAASYGHKIFKMQNQQPNLTDKEIIQQLLNGLFEQNKLPDPTTIVPCIDDKTAHSIVDFAGKFLDKAANAKVTDVVGLVEMVKSFGDSIPQSVKDCLNGNAQFAALGLKYGIDDKTDSSVIEKKIITYVTLHYPTVHGWLGKLNDNWKAGKYYQVGFDGAGYGHNILGVTQEPNLTDKEILQTTLNGLFEPNKLPDPTTIVVCFDDDSAKRTVAFVGTILHELALLTPTNPSQVQKIKDDAQKFGDSLPQAVKDCLNDNQEIKNLGDKYGINDKTDKDALQKHIIAYLSLHYFSVHKSFQDIDNTWHKGGYKQTGNKLASLGHDIIKMTPQDIRKLVAQK